MANERSSQLVVDYHDGGSDSDAGFEISHRTRAMFPHSDFKFCLNTITLERYFKRKLPDLWSSPTPIESLKLDGFIVQLKVRDGLSLGMAYDEKDTNLKWACVPNPVSVSCILCFAMTDYLCIDEALSLPYSQRA
jgi:hypothetical protein